MELRKNTKEELQEILKKHKLWLKTEGKEGERANLSGADLRHADLRGADLTDADLSYANLSDADLTGADLTGAELYCAELSGANLTDADLFGAVLRGAELSGADLFGANLSYANLTGAILPENEKYRLGIILKEPIIGYKKCRDDVIVKLEIPKGAIVFSINGKKCRTNIAKVLEISGDNKEAISICDSKFIYKVGKTYKIKDFYSVYNVECSTGIHFFKTRKEAEEYQY